MAAWTIMIFWISSLCYPYLGFLHSSWSPWHPWETGCSRNGEHKEGVPCTTCTGYSVRRGWKVDPWPPAIQGQPIEPGQSRLLSPLVAIVSREQQPPLYKVDRVVCKSLRNSAMSCRLSCYAGLWLRLLVSDHLLGYSCICSARGLPSSPR